MIEPLAPLLHRLAWLFSCVGLLLALALEVGASDTPVAPPEPATRPARV